jgi:hypothetical protein
VPSFLAQNPNLPFFAHTRIITMKTKNAAWGGKSKDELI